MYKRAWLLALVAVTGCLPTEKTPNPVPTLTRLHLPAKQVLTAEIEKIEPKSDPFDAKNQAPEPPAKPEEKAAPAPLKQLFIGPETAALYDKFWPGSTSARLRALRGRVHWYDESSVPGVYQVWDRGTAGGVAKIGGAGQTANDEFPWARPAGVPAVSNVQTLRFIKFADEPIRWWRAERTDGTFFGYSWRFPEGTVFGELLLVTDPDGFHHCCELRTREKKQGTTWTMQSYRPCPTRADLDAALEKHNLKLGDLFYKADEFGRTTWTLNSGHQRDGFVGSAHMTTLPHIPAKVVNKILKETPFKPSLGKQFAADIPAPTADDYSIVPIGYTGAFIPVGDTSCMRCHDRAGSVVNLAGESRWRLRGSDGIFSWHPFDAASLDSPPVKFNERLARAKLLKEWK